MMIGLMTRDVFMDVIDNIKSISTINKLIFSFVRSWINKNRKFVIYVSRQRDANPFKAYAPNNFTICLNRRMVLNSIPDSVECLEMSNKFNQSVGKKIDIRWGLQPTHR